MKVIVSAFGGAMKGLFDTPQLSPDIRFIIPKSLEYIRSETKWDETSKIIDDKLATFKYTSKTEMHYQYGELPVYELSDIS